MYCKTRNIERFDSLTSRSISLWPSRLCRSFPSCSILDCAFGSARNDRHRFFFVVVGAPNPNRVGRDSGGSLNPLGDWVNRPYLIRVHSWLMMLGHSPFGFRLPRRSRGEGGWLKRSPRKK